MAIVADASGLYLFPIDKKLTSPNRTAATVSGSLTPTYVGELAADTTKSVIMRGTGVSANTDWTIDRAFLGQ